MAAPNEGTTTLPSDAASNYHLGLWDGTYYRAWRGDANGSGKILLVDASGNALIKAEDAAHASGDPGIQALGVRKDTAAALAGTDGDYIPLIVDANGRLHVVQSGLELTDDAAFTTATSKVLPLGATYQSTVDEVDANDVGAPRMSKRRVMMNGADYVRATLANNAQPRSASTFNYTLSDVLAEDIITTMRHWHITMYTTLDQATSGFYISVPSWACDLLGAGNRWINAGSHRLLTGITIPAGTNYIMYHPEAMGFGEGGTQQAVPGLTMLSDLRISFVFSVAPTSGGIYIVVEGHS